MVIVNLRTLAENFTELKCEVVASSAKDVDEMLFGFHSSFWWQTSYKDHHKKLIPLTFDPRKRPIDNLALEAARAIKYPEGTRAEPTGVFLSYRRNDSADITRALYTELVRKFGASSIFIDVDAIAPGSDFRNAISSALCDSKVVLAIIGTHWHIDQKGVKLFFRDADMVRLEIEIATSFGIKILPVLVRGATMPSPTDISPTVRDIVYRHAIKVREGAEWSRDVRYLISQLI